MNGASTCAAAFTMSLILRSRSDQKVRASRQLAKQALQYNALSKTLDIAAENFRVEIATMVAYALLTRFSGQESDHNNITKIPILQLRSETERAPRRGSSSYFAKPQNSCKAKTALRTTITQNFFTF